MTPDLNLGNTTDLAVLSGLARDSLQDHLARLTALLFSGRLLLDELESSSSLEHLSQLVEMAGELADEVFLDLGGSWTSVLDTLQERLSRVAALLVAGRLLIDEIESSGVLEHLSQLVEMAGELADKSLAGLDEFNGCAADVPRLSSHKEEREVHEYLDAPVHEYLDGLVWDRVPRIDRWLVDYAGADDTEAVREASRTALVAAVRRAKHPGCVVAGMLVLEGAQGSGKSEALRILAVKSAWLGEDPFHDENPARLMESTEGKWIVEVPLSKMTSSEAERLKANLSTRVDAARLAFQHKITRVSRRFVCVGTTSEADFLPDPTGNRRFWPVRIRRFDLPRLRVDRDQLWAEAVAVEAGHEASVVDETGIHQPAATEQETQQCGDDPIFDVLHRALSIRTGRLRVSDAYLICGIEPGKANQDQIERFGRAIRALGWERQRRHFDGEYAYAYVKGSPEQREVELIVEYDPHMRSVRIEVAGAAKVSTPATLVTDEQRDSITRESVAGDAVDCAVVVQRGIDRACEVEAVLALPRKAPGWPSNRCRAVDAPTLFDSLLPRALKEVTALHVLFPTNYHFRIGGDESGPAGEWLVDCAVVPPTCVRVDGRPSHVAHCVEVSHEDLGILLDKPDLGLTMYFQNKLNLRGDPASMFKFQQLFDLVAAIELPDACEAPRA